MMPADIDAIYPGSKHREYEECTAMSGKVPLVPDLFILLEPATYWNFRNSYDHVLWLGLHLVVNLLLCQLENKP